MHRIFGRWLVSSTMKIYAIAFVFGFRKFFIMLLIIGHSRFVVGRIITWKKLEGDYVFRKFLFIPFYFRTFSGCLSLETVVTHRKLKLDFLYRPFSHVVHALAGGVRFFCGCGCVSFLA